MAKAGEMRQRHLCLGRREQEIKIRSIWLKGHREGVTVLEQ